MLPSEKKARQLRVVSASRARMVKGTSGWLRAAHVRWADVGQELAWLHEQSISHYMISPGDVRDSLNFTRASKSFRKRAMGSGYELVSDLH